MKTEFTLKSNAWYTKLMNYVWDIESKHVFTNLCPFFWLTIFNIIAFIPVVIIREPIRFITYLQNEREVAFYKKLDKYYEMIAKFEEVCFPSIPESLLRNKNFIRKLCADIRFPYRQEEIPNRWELANKLEEYANNRKRRMPEMSVNIIALTKKTLIGLAIILFICFLIMSVKAPIIPNITTTVVLLIVLVVIFWKHLKPIFQFFYAMYHKVCPGVKWK